MQTAGCVVCVLGEGASLQLLGALNIHGIEPQFVLAIDYPYSLNIISRVQISSTFLTTPTVQLFYAYNFPVTPGMITCPSR
jgi:hypothetical protein